MIAELVLVAALTVMPLEDTQPPAGVPDPGTGDGEVVEIIPEEEGEEGDLIVLPGDDFSSSSDDSSDDSIPAPGSNPGAGENSQGDVIDEPVSDSSGDTVVIISPDDLAAILQSADDVALLADYGSTGDSLLSGSFLTYCQGLAARIPWGSHYVAWRDNSDYYSDSYFAYGDLSESNGQFSGDVRVLRYYCPSSGSDYVLSWSNDSSFELDASNGFAYSDLGEFPALNGGETHEAALIWLVGLGIVLRVLGWILFGRYGR